MKILRNGGLSLIPLMAYFGIQLARADSFDVMNVRFSGVSQSLHAVAFGNGVYVAVGDGGTILSSRDSVTWIPQGSGTTNRLNGVVCGANGFVAVGEASTILTSADGFTWFRCASPVSNKLSAVTYGVGRYVAVGSSGIVVTSTNGASWSSVNTEAPYNFNGVGFYQDANDIFVLVGDSGTIMTSADGLAWTLRSSGTFSRLNAVSLTHSPNFESFSMVAVGDSGTLEISSDGVNWTVVSSGTSANLLAIVVDEKPPRFGVVGQGGVFLTGNGSTWSFRTSGTSTNLNGVLYARGNFLVVGDSGLIEAATPWLPRDPGTTQGVGSVNFCNGSFFAVGGSTSNSFILRSTNGSVWTTVYTGGEYGLGGVAYGTNGYLANDFYGTVLLSSNGLNWSRHTIGAPTNNTVFQGGPAYGNGIYMAPGVLEDLQYPYTLTPVAYLSSDGLIWSGPYTLNHGVYGITFANNIFVTSSVGGAIDTSPDGIHWTTGAYSGGATLNAVGFGNGLFVAGGGGGVMVSSDGTNWTGVSTVPASALAFGDQGFVALYGGSYSTSPDGTNWTVRGFDGPTGGVAFGNDTYILAGGGISQIVPTNAQATPLLSGQMVNQGFKLSALSQPNYSYHILGCTNVASTNWWNVYSYTSTQAVTVITDAIPAGGSPAYYRIVTP